MADVLVDSNVLLDAAVEGMTLLTRDRGRYGTYFPTLKVLSPP